MLRDWRVSPILPEDRVAVSTFVRSAVWQYTHVDYPREEVLSRPGYQAHNDAGKRIGVMGCGMDTPPLAHLLFAAVDRREFPRAVMSTLLEPNARDMRDAGATELTFLGWAPWLVRSLESTGFEVRTTVITYQRRASVWQETGNRDVRVRPALSADVEALVALDRAAFEPMWRYSAGIHRQLVGSAAHCTIAEHDGVLVGYQTGDISRDQGHIIRLAVHPDWQGRGVGTRLLADVIAFFHSCRVRGIMVNTQADNTVSRRLYERAGFTRWDEEAPALVKCLRPAPARMDCQSGEVYA